MVIKLFEDIPLPGKRIVYGPGPLRFAELRLPTGPGPHPAVIAIHGGYWRNRYDHVYFGHLCRHLTDLGIATWNIEYRRVGDVGGGFPGTFHDVVAASRKLIEMAPQYRIDPTRISAIGHSAGGHLACWLAGIRHVDPASEIAGMAVPLRSVVSFGGVYDLPELFAANLSNGAAAEFLGTSPDAHPGRFDAASPSRLLPLGVPQLIIHGTLDEAVPYAWAETYSAAATKAGDAVTFVGLPGVDHFDIVNPSTDVWRQIEPAVVRHLQG